ncbi:MAG: M1 family metallopeptidase [Anaerolineales bacterium]|nr:M1 family metallopeptidase [Anaerolineales bacterium]
MKIKSTLFMFAIVLLVLSACTPTATPTQAPAVETAPPVENTEKEVPSSQTTPAVLMPPQGDLTMFEAGLIGLEQTLLPELDAASVYVINLEIPIGYKTVRGFQEVRYTNRESVALNEVYFRLFPNASGGTATISNLSVDGAPVAPIYEAADTALKVPLETPLEPGESLVITLDFELGIPREMGGNYGLFGYFNDVLVLDEFYPVIPVFDDEGWYAEYPADNGDFPYFDASFYIVNVTAPDDLTLVASGSTVDHSAANGMQHVTYAIGPARDFYLAASEHFIQYSDQIGETVVNSYALEEYPDAAQLALKYAVASLASFGDRFGPYPYTEFDVVSTPMLALGIEYPGLTGITIGTYDLNTQISGMPAQAMLETVVAHEVGHQWFYNAVGSDQMEEPWVDESVTQYVTWLYFLDTYGEAGAQGFADSLNYRWSRVEYEAIPVGLPAYDYQGSEYSAIVYGRGPLFLIELEKQLGSETFADAMQDYYQTYKWGIATTEDFRAVLEAHCNCDLEPMFTEWVYAK